MTDFSKFTDHELAAILKEGNPLAYTEIFDRYKVVLYKHAFQMLNSQEEANDVIQDVFLALWDKRDTINLKTSLSAYLYSSVRNRIFDLISHQKVISRYIDSIRDFITEGSYTADAQVREKQLANIIVHKIKELGGTSFLPILGGSTIEIIKKIFGWKIARHLQYYLYK